MRGQRSRKEKTEKSILKREGGVKCGTELRRIRRRRGGIVKICRGREGRILVGEGKEEVSWGR